MKKLFIILILSLGFLFTKAQVDSFPVKQNLGSAKTLITVPSGGAIRSVVINGVFIDTSQANTYSYFKHYPGAMIFAGNALWFRDSAGVRWVQILPSGGVSGQSAWLLNGNDRSLYPDSATLGTSSYNDWFLMSNNQKFIKFSKDGITDSSVNVIPVGIDTIDGSFAWARASGGGGGGATDTALISEIVKDSIDANTLNIRNPNDGDTLATQPATNELLIKSSKPGYGTLSDNVTDTTFGSKVDTIVIAAKPYVLEKIKDTVQTVLDYLTLNTVTDFATFSKYANSVIVKDTIRGGTFTRYTGSDAADDGMVFADALGRKWLRQTSDTKINVAWYGAVATNTIVDQRPKFILARDYIYSHIAFNTLYIPATPSLYYYVLSDSILFNKNITILGSGTLWGGIGSKIFVAANKSGFVFKYNYGDEACSAKVENLYFTQQTSTDKTTFAIKSYVFIHIINVEVSTFAGNGTVISSCAALPSGDNNNFGNADHSIIEYTNTYSCLNGIFIEGCDANVIEFNNISSNSNKRWGVYDNGMLGNHYTQPHTAANAYYGLGGESTASYGGLYYVAIPGHDGYYGDALDSNFNKRPDLNVGTYWAEIPAILCAAWDSTVRYYSGGPQAVIGGSAWTTLTNPYAESAQPPFWLGCKAKIDNGDIVGVGVIGCGAWWNMNSGEQALINSNLIVVKGISSGGQSPTAPVDVQITNGGPYENNLALYLRSAATGVVQQKFNSTAGTGYLSWTNGEFGQFVLGNWITYTGATGFRPGSDNALDLGAATTGRWKNIYAALGAGVGTHAVRINPVTGLLTRADTTLPGATPSGADYNLQMKLGASLYGSDSIRWDAANAGFQVKGYFQGDPATGDVIMKDGAGNIAFRSTNANNWLTPTLAQYYQIGTFNSPVAFTAQGGTTMAQSQFASSKFQITAGTYNLAALPTNNFEIINSVDRLKFSINDSGMVDAKGRLSTDSTLHTLGITQVPVFDSTYKIDVVDGAGKHFKSYWPTAASTVPLSGVTAATATNDVDHSSYRQIWRWNNLTSSGGLSLSSVSTGAASNNLNVLTVESSGANSNSSETTYGARFYNQHTGTSSTNVAGYFSASNGTNNYAIIADVGRAGFGTTTPNSGVQINGSLSLSTVTKTATYTATSSDYTIICSTNTFTIDLPTAVGITGRVYVIKNITSGTTITVDGNGTETIDGATTYTLASQYKLVMIQSDGANWNVISNN